MGVDLNTASMPLLARVAGVSSAIAKNIILFREENGAFKSRSELKKCLNSVLKHLSSVPAFYV